MNGRGGKLTFGKLLAAGLLAVKLDCVPPGSIFEAMPACWTVVVAGLLGDTLICPGGLRPRLASVGGVG